MSETAAAPATETEAARLVATGELPSPTPYGDTTLMALRITATGLAYRAGLQEFVWRDPAIFTSNEFLARCAGLPVVWEHPPSGTLDAEEFGRRVVGSLMFAWVKGDDVWGIARLYDDDAIATMTEQPMSTSPSVTFLPTDGNVKLTDDSGTTLLIEGRPALLSHLSIVAQGVWDKNGPPTGVRADSDKGYKMTTGKEIRQPDESTKPPMADQLSRPAPEGDPSATTQVLERLLGVLTGLTAKVEELTSRVEKSEQRGGARGEGGELDEGGEGRGPAGKPGDPAETAADALKREREHMAEFSDIQNRADAVAHAFGKQAPPPMLGETPTIYRKRLINRFQCFSPAWKNAEIGAIKDPAVLDAAEAAVFADAIAASRQNDLYPADALIPITTTSPSGHRITEFRGRSTFIALLKPASTMHVKRFNLPEHRNNRPN